MIVLLQYEIFLNDENPNRKKHFKQKSLIILRVCNELLRRLSRAENTVFCGRVFIFLFQSFPLGDRSSVNLRGEFHIENATTFESLPDPDMEVDGVSDERRSMDRLYTQFWRLQTFFSQPTRLFTRSDRDTFRNIVAQTMIKFQTVQQEQQGRLAADAPRSAKRRRSADIISPDSASVLISKYLTSRDLFDLEIRDLAFRRHILVQVLMLLDFLLSLSGKAKGKIEQALNKSVLYNFTLEESDMQWATNLRQEIALYLQQGPEGKFYYRMVDTVLARDKNWVHWKADGCPLISREAVSAEDYAEAKNNIQKNCTNRRLRTSAMGTLDLRFLSEQDGIEKLQRPDRYIVPTVESFRAGVAADALDYDMASSKEEKRAATDAKASKLWRAMRLASRNRLATFDKLDDKDNAPLFDELDTDVLSATHSDEDNSKTECDNSKPQEHMSIAPKPKPNSDDYTVEEQTTVGSPNGPPDHITEPLNEARSPHVAPSRLSSAPPL